jgi:hypothetical protein
MRQNALRKATGLQTLELRNYGGSVLLLIYDEAAMRAVLCNDRATDLLTQYGYSVNGSLADRLQRLQSRFMEDAFPHEIGVFLGYPAEDVWGFIVNHGKNCVCCRHWKVYFDEARAREIFYQIDEAHNRAMDLLYEPVPLHIAANLLKAG